MSVCVWDVAAQSGLARVFMINPYLQELSVDGNEIVFALPPCRSSNGCDDFDVTSTLTFVINCELCDNQIEWSRCTAFYACISPSPTTIRVTANEIAEYSVTAETPVQAPRPTRPTVAAQPRVACRTGARGAPSPQSPDPTPRE